MTYSFPKNLYSPVLWPFTLDYGYTLVCNIARCPQDKYPGMWILPVVVLMDYREQKPCAYVDDCANMPREKNEAYQVGRLVIFLISLTRLTITEVIFFLKTKCPCYQSSRDYRVIPV